MQIPESQGVSLGAILFASDFIVAAIACGVVGFDLKLRDMGQMTLHFV